MFCDTNALGAFYKLGAQLRSVILIYFHAYTTHTLTYKHTAILTDNDYTCMCVWTWYKWLAISFMSTSFPRRVRKCLELFVSIRGSVASTQYFSSPQVLFIFYYIIYYFLYLLLTKVQRIQLCSVDNITFKVIVRCDS